MNLKLCAVFALFAVFAIPWTALGDILVGDPFVSSGYNGWIDPNNGINPNQSAVNSTTAPAANWAVSLLSGGMQETSDGWFGEGSSSANGLYTPYLLINDNYTTPSSYTYSTTLSTYDDDGFGVVFGYQGPGDYFRVGLRKQASNKGFPTGVSVQKVSLGGITHLGTSTAFTPTVSVNQTNNTPVTVNVKVDGTNWAVYINGDKEENRVLNGSDSSLAAGKVGLQSWYQRAAGATNAKWGVDASQVKVSDAAGTSTLFQDTFAAASPVQWRSLQMANAAGVKGTGGDDVGNFRLDFRNGTIVDDSNGYESATTAAPNTDFLGPAVVVNEANSTSMTNYEMKVRLMNLDDDDIGVLVRAQDDNNFYRINFTKETDAVHGSWLVHQRAPMGMSIQKVRNGVWSELYRDSSWTFTDDSTAGVPAQPFDLLVRAVGNQLFVELIDDPDGAKITKTYPIITDSSDPILSGSVGFTNWGSGDVNNGAIFGRYGGRVGEPLLIEASVIPEPASCLLACGLLGLAILRRRS